MSAEGNGEMVFLEEGEEAVEEEAPNREEEDAAFEQQKQLLLKDSAYAGELDLLLSQQQGRGLRVRKEVDYSERRGVRRRAGDTGAEPAKPKRAVKDDVLEEMVANGVGLSTLSAEEEEMLPPHVIKRQTEYMKVHAPPCARHGDPMHALDTRPPPPNLTTHPGAQPRAGALACGREPLPAQGRRGRARLEQTQGPRALCVGLPQHAWVHQLRWVGGRTQCMHSCMHACCSVCARATQSNATLNTRNAQHTQHSTHATLNTRNTQHTQHSTHAHATHATRKLNTTPPHPRHPHTLQASSSRGCRRSAPLLRSPWGRWS
jgi:hypothetical protein